MKKKLHEWLSLQTVKNPGMLVLFCILLFNVLFFIASAALISALSLEGTEKMSFIEAAFCTVTMILDAGCIQFVVADIGESGVIITVVCLVIILIGMISFTGAVIGYVTNYISSFIENASSGRRKLFLSGHFVILNWNTRACEIVNDMLYSGKRQTIVVLTPSRRDEIEKEIEERISDTVSRERLRRNLTVIVREGDVFSSKQLYDISLDKARSVIILGNDTSNSTCKYEMAENALEKGRGNSQTIKTLMQVADITSKETSAKNQRIIVEIVDSWTGELVDKIISAKQKEGFCNIIPVKVGEVLGQILSQFCLMPELNAVYSELFSSKGAEFYSRPCKNEHETVFVSEYFKEHSHALPLTVMNKNGKYFSYFVANDEDDVERRSSVCTNIPRVILNESFKMEKKNIIILGHNSKCRDIMAGFEGFSREWKTGDEEIISIVVIDEKKNLEKMNYYSDYSFVTETIEADIFDKELITDTIDRVVASAEGDTSVLILSDDTASKENTDAAALANLVYVRDIIDRRLKADPDFDTESIDLIVEIINPKHHDIVNGYSVNNIVISNKYISKMITQISEVEELFDFYNDILTYDTAATGDEGSKEIYIKRADRYFDAVPPKTTADRLVRAIYAASSDENSSDVNPAVLIGYVRPHGEIKIFGGDLSQIKVELRGSDKLILFSEH